MIKQHMSSHCYFRILLLWLHLSRNMDSLYQRSHHRKRIFQKPFEVMSPDVYFRNNLHNRCLLCRHMFDMRYCSQTLLLRQEGRLSHRLIEILQKSEDQCWYLFQYNKRILKDPAPNRSNTSNIHLKMDMFHILTCTNCKFLSNYLYNNQRDNWVNINFRTGFLFCIFDMCPHCKFHSRLNKVMYNIVLDSKDLESYRKYI